MALGSMIQNKDKNSYKNVQIVPVGLNYFKREKFRSEVIIEYGRAFEIPSEWAEEFKTNKKLVTEKLLKEIESRMKAVTLRAPSYEELRALHLLRKIYLPKKVKLTPTEYSELCKNFAKGFEKLKEDPDCQDKVKRINNYVKEIEEIAITDTEINNSDFKHAMMSRKFYWATFVFIICLIFILPGYLMLIPFIIYIKRKAEKERLAVS